MHTDVADPLARLRAVREATASAKATDRAIGARQMTDISRFVPSATLALAGRLVTGLGLGSRARFANCTIADNYAGGLGGGVWMTGGAVENSIV